MKKKSFYPLSLAGVIMLAASMFAGCTEYADDPAKFTTENIVINYTDSVTDASISPGSRTRSVPESTKIGSSVLTSKSGKKLYLNCTEAPWPVEKTAQTRGTKVTTATIGTIGISASVYPAANSYTSAGCGSYFYKESVSSGTPMSYYWPTTDYRISFFGYYPYNNAAFTVQSAASATGAPTYAYTVPSTISNQLDIMTGQDVDHLGGSSSPVNMTLAHRCSAIHFSITNDRSDAITVNSISIEGVKYTGTLSGSTWTLGSGVNSSSTNPFTLSSNASVAADATVDITGTSNIFMMLPQTLPSGAKLKVVVDDEEFETDLSGSWVAGKEYTYTISMSESCIDLSMVDNAGNPRESMTTANCYLVHSVGKYKIPLVYGNAIKNGTANIQAYSPTASSNSETYLTPFINHNGTGITGPWITKNGAGIDAGMGLTATSATLIWQDVMGLISAVGVNGDYLTFTVGAFIPGNALIAVKDVSGTILWSWHIWVTSETYTNLTSVNTGDFEYHVAPVNLGWVSINENGKQGFCPYYQWGRKDPEIPSTGDGNYNHDAYDITGNSVSMVQKTYTQTGTGEGYGTIQNGIKYPLNHYFNYISNNNGIYGPFQSWQYNLWDADCVGIVAAANSSISVLKTVYDPCPPGFCIPSGGLCYYMYTTRDAFAGSFDSTNKGYNWNGSLWFPATGMRGRDSGQTPSNVEIYGYCWSSSKGGKSSAYANFYATTFFAMTTANTAPALPIRPVAEE